MAALRSPKVREMLEGQKVALATLAETRRKVAPEGYDLWIHAASLGEFEQGRPFIERFRRQFPDRKILLTFFSPSGYRVRHGYDKADMVVYLPFDTPALVSAFLDAAVPHMAIFVKYEFWGNYLQQLRCRDVPTYIISAIFRPSQRFFRPGGKMFRRMLRCFTKLYVQDTRSRDLLAGIGIDNVAVTGDTRFDRVTDILRLSLDVPVIKQFAENSEFTLVAGSSWEADEHIYIPWLKANPQVKAVIAPHEFNGERLRLLEEQLGGGTRRISDINREKPLTGDEQYIILDCFGLLSSIYRYGSAAYVGGGFGAGIHNINEAAVYGIPVIFGPRHDKFKEASDLIACGGGFSINDAASARKVLDRMLSDKDSRKAAGQAAENYIKTNIGSTDAIFNDIFKDQKSPQS